MLSNPPVITAQRFDHIRDQTGASRPTRAVSDFAASSSGPTARLRAVFEFTQNVSGFGSHDDSGSFSARSKVKDRAIGELPTHR